MAEKKRFLAKHSKSSAFIISLIVHAVVIVAALWIVAVKVIAPDEHDGFTKVTVKQLRLPEPKVIPPTSTPTKVPPALARPMQITTDRTREYATVAIPEIAVGPGELTGLKHGESILTSMLDFPPFGTDEDSAMGNELVGTFYDLKQTRDGESQKMNINTFFAALAHFAGGWSTGRLDDYFQAPRKKYSTLFMIPTTRSTAATEAFGVSDIVTPDFWAAYYTGHIAAPKTGYYRFHGYGDDILLVRIKKRLVLDAGFEGYRTKLQTGWESDDDNNRRFPIGDQLLYIGDWFKLEKGEVVRMDVLIGDVGGLCSSQLLIEQRGVEYKQIPFEDGSRSVLPVFKLAEIPANLRDQIRIDPAAATLDGPTFGVVVK